VARECNHHTTPQHNNMLTLVAFACSPKPLNSCGHQCRTSIQLRCKPSLSAWQGTRGPLGSNEAHVDKAKGGPIWTHLKPLFYLFI
jgi:hypothetical protein